MLPVTQRHHPPAQREKRTKSVSMFRLGFLLLLGGMVLMAGHWYVTTTSSATYAPHPSMMATPEPAENNAEGAVSDLYIEMEESIRSRMQVGIIDVAEPGELEEALLIELRRVRVDVTSVRAPVMKWVGRMRDVPQSAEFRIRIRSNGGEFDRELASISMVVGKYIQHYSLDVARFEVVFDLDEGSRSQVIEPELARRLYLQRLALMEFLQQV